MSAYRIPNDGKAFQSDPPANNDLVATRREALELIAVFLEDTEFSWPHNGAWTVSFPPSPYRHSLTRKLIRGWLECHARRVTPTDRYVDAFYHYACACAASEHSQLDLDRHIAHERHVDDARDRLHVMDRGARP